MQSWATALLLRAAIGSAIDKKVDLNGPNLIAEMAAIKDFDGDGVFGAPISFENNRIPYGVLYRYNIEGGKLTVTEETPWGRIE